MISGLSTFPDRPLSVENPVSYMTVQFHPMDKTVYFRLDPLYAFQVYFRTFVVIIFRLLPAIFLGDGIYGDEQDEFECVGTQPGCRNMCFTEFSPMQPPRMWCLQILLSCVPPVIFNFYAARQTAQEKI